VWCWCASGLAGLTALATGAADLTGVRQRLVDTGAAAAPDATRALLRSGADRAVLTVFAGLAALVLLTLGCLALFLRGHAGWRGPLAVLTLLTVAVDALAQDLFRGAPAVDRTAVMLQGVLAVVALALLTTPGSRAWARR
jgi:uncharacterized membrane protein